MRILCDYLIIVLLGAITFWSCTSTKGDLAVVKSVDIQKYSGRWYEIMRLPNSFESGLICVTADYSIKENGDIKVVNSGHKINDVATIKTATGTAWVPNIDEPTKLKVRFFWPFSGNYWIIALDPDYQFAMIGDPSRDYLWILARDKALSEETIASLLAQAKSQGFDVAKLERIPQNCP